MKKKAYIIPGITVTAVELKHMVLTSDPKTHDETGNGQQLSRRRRRNNWEDEEEEEDW